MQNYTERMRAGEHWWWELHCTTIILKIIFFKIIYGSSNYVTRLKHKFDQL